MAALDECLVDASLLKSCFVIDLEGGFGLLVVSSVQIFGMAVAVHMLLLLILSL